MIVCKLNRIYDYGKEFKEDSSADKVKNLMA